VVHIFSQGLTLDINGRCKLAGHCLLDGGFASDFRDIDLVAVTSFVAYFSSGATRSCFFLNFGQIVS